MKEIEELGYIIENLSAVMQRIKDLEGMNKRFRRKYYSMYNEMKGLESDLRDCHDLLNDCGFFYENGTWIDGDNREGEE